MPHERDVTLPGVETTTGKTPVIRSPKDCTIVVAVGIESGVQFLGMYLNPVIELQNGDMVEVIGPLPFPRHVGVYAQGRGFVHNAKGGSVQLTDAANFAGGHPIRVIWRVAGTWAEQEQAVQRAINLIGMPYNLLNFNCEHVAYYALTRQARSPQLGFAVLALLVIGLFFLD